ncbi:MAG: right-handed parallel beta-helix repeat-containing protein, partial [Methanogenium sp.]|nr:right-handed parallel beta-helix repeat-containing protein [Methanogenium sp.]
MYSGGYIKTEGDNNIIENNDCMKIETSGNSPVITENIVKDSPSEGISTIYGNGSVITRNQVSGTADYGIKVTTDCDPLIKYNIISDSGNSGIYLGSLYTERIYNVTLYNNTVNTAQNYGIMGCTPFSGAEILQNRISDCVSYGIYVRGEDLKVNKNKMTNCSGGVYSRVSNSELINNYVKDSNYGIELDYSYGWYGTYGYNTVKDNTILSCNIGLSVLADNSTVINNTISGGWRGIMCSGSSNITVAGNTIQNNTGSGFYIYKINKANVTNNTLFNISIDNYLDEAAFYLRYSNNVTVHNNSIDRGSRGIYVEFTGDGNLIEKNIITNGSASGIFVRSTEGGDPDKYYRGHSDLIIRDNTINSPSGRGISLTCIDNVKVLNNEISNVSKGITLHCVNNTRVEKNNITKTITSGIEFGPFWALNGGCYYNTISGNSVECEGTGIKIDAENSTVSSNTVTGYSMQGIHILRGDGTTINKNTLKRDTNEGGWDFYIETEEGFFQDTLYLVENTIGTANPTNLTLTNISDQCSVRSVETPPEPPAPPEYNTTKTSIGKWAEVVNLTKELEMDIEFHYTDEEIADYNESTLRIWKYNGSVWDEGGDGINSWDNKHWLDVDRNLVGVRINHCCIFAPLTGKPVHNPRLEKDYMTITEALDDFETRDGDTITVDPGYTGTKENIWISNQITLKSSTNQAASVTIEALDPKEPVIKVDSGDVIIDGFVIKGSTSAQGVLIEGCEIVKIQNCEIKDNYFGAAIIKEDFSPNSPSKYCTISDTIFSGNTNGAVYINASDDNNVLDCEIKDPVGVAIETGISNLVSDCTFTGNEDYAVIVQCGSENEIMYNDFSDAGIGLYFYNTDKNTVSDCEFNDISDVALSVEESDNNIFKDITVDSFEKGVLLTGSDSNSFTKCNFTGDYDSFVTGFSIDASDGNTISDCGISDIASVGYAIKGIEIFGGSCQNKISDIVISGFESSKCEGVSVWSDKNEIDNISISGFRGAASGAYGIKLVSGSNIVKNCEISGIMAQNDSYGLIVSGDYGNTVRDCSISDITSPNVSAEVSLQNSGYSNSLLGITVGNENKTTFNLQGEGNVTIRTVSNPPADDGDVKNIGHYLEINAGTESDISLQVCYTAEDLKGKDPALLSVWKHTGTEWSQPPPPNGVNTVEMYAYAENITEFSVFAPMWSGKGLPV